MSETWYEVRWCCDLRSEWFRTVEEARAKARKLISEDEEDVHIVRVIAD